MTSEREVRVLRAADRTAEAWKNGGGVTRQIAARPEGPDAAGFAWRVSLAEVAADGPFSAFPGVDRTLTLAEGAGMDLTVDGVRRLVDERYVPQRFAGDVPTGCRLIAGPVVNFNVMYRRDAVRAEVSVVRGDLALTVPPGAGALLVVALAGPVLLDGPGLAEGPGLSGEPCLSGEACVPGDPPGGPVRLGTYDALLATGGEQGVLHLGAEGRAAVVRFTPGG
ncbi:HutD family protein [Streptomyces sp. G-G2]|uniref:HutD/Ves family protein n=1 Tax=Streptomyces sp. G-G2 TaxID=3046201 RepID=UPI0024B8C611|nr:HutD family protein [Streptomyces sp. G-G2]MDJ0380007.1 HutD family protein [Streptomyces sp. G-G2]